MRKFVLPIAVFVAFSIAGWLIFDSKSTADALSNGTSFGAWVETRNGQNEISAFEELEQRLGAQLPLVRGFNQWEDNLGEDRRFHRWARDGGRDLAVSIKPQRSNGTVIPWRDIANAQPGSRLYQEMQELASGARRYNDNMMVIFHHEPEAGDNTKFGTSSEFQGAFRKLVDVFRAEGASNVEFGWVMTDWAFNVGNFNPNDRRRAELWFPGTNYVDFIGADVYNWNNCRGNTTDPWRSLEELLQPFLNWSSRHPDIPLIIGEVSSAEGGGDRKAQWIDEARNTLSTGVHRDRIAAVMWFHDDGVQDGWPNCQWWLDSSSSSFSAAQRLAQDSFFQAPLRFGATPTPLLQPPHAHRRPPPRRPRLPRQPPLQPPLGLQLQPRHAHQLQPRHAHRRRPPLVRPLPRQQWHQRRERLLPPPTKHRRLRRLARLHRPLPQRRPLRNPRRNRQLHRKPRWLLHHDLNQSESR